MTGAGEERDGTVRAVVRGHVQGVGFRAATRDRLERLGLRGEARNEADGSVVVTAHGGAAARADLLAWLRGGDTPGRVDAVEETDVEPPR